jgi:transcriptional regulator with XRE-family HTH domain
MTDFGQWLDVEIRNRGIKACDMAKTLHVHDSVISRWRNGTCTPQASTIWPLASYLDVDPLRLAVTAGLVDRETARVPPYEVPMDHHTIARVREALEGIRGLTKKERKHLLSVYVELQKEKSRNVPQGG